MSHDASDRFTKGILDRLDVVEERPRIDRDGRHGLVAFGVIVLVLGAMVSIRALMDASTGNADGDRAVGLPLVSPDTVLEAVDRIRVPAEVSPAEPSESRETPTTPGRYEAIDATAPGCRT